MVIRSASARGRLTSSYIQPRFPLRFLDDIFDIEGGILAAFLSLNEGAAQGLHLLLVFFEQPQRSADHLTCRAVAAILDTGGNERLKMRAQRNARTFAHSAMTLSSTK